MSCVILATGLSGSGKTTVLNKAHEILREEGYKTKRLDGDIGRKSYSSDLGFSKEDRLRNHERAASVASYLELEGYAVLCSYIAPYQEARDLFKKICSNTKIVFIDCTIEECQKRDPKGMYAKLQDGLFMGSPFTGIHPNAPYNPPNSPDLVIKTGGQGIEQSASELVQFLKNNNLLEKTN
jgi:adenylyl-sulfate kinase